MPLFKIPNMTTSDSTWASVDGYEGLYEVSVDGLVRSTTHKVLTSRGCYQTAHGRVLKSYNGIVTLSKGGITCDFKVCDLVAKAFIPSYVDGQVVYHVEGDSDAVSNLSLTPVLHNTQDDGWKDIPNYEGYYQASTDGQIRSIDRVVDGHNTKVIKRGKILAQQLGDDGYYHCLLSKDGVAKLYSIHRLIAITYIPNPENKPQVNHIDGDKVNNAVDNLEWVTQSENMQHAKESGLWSPEHCGHVAKSLTGKPVRCVTDDKLFKSISEAATFYNMDFESVKDSIRLKRLRKGKLFEYATKE